MRLLSILKVLYKAFMEEGDCLVSPWREVVSVSVLLVPTKDLFKLSQAIIHVLLFDLDRINLFSEVNLDLFVDI